MSLALVSALPTLWPLGAAEVRAALTAVHAGASPSSLDLVHRPSLDPAAVPEFWRQAQKWLPFDTANIARMSDHDRAWAETVLVSRVTHGDVNALRALVALSVPLWRGHARAALPFLEKLVAGPGHVEAIMGAYRDALSA